MWALSLLLVSALFSAAVADKTEVQQWTEVLRQAADRFVKTGANLDSDAGLQKVENQMPYFATYHWVHKDSSGDTYFCGGAGGSAALKWIIRYMAKCHQIKAFDRGQATGDEIAVWNVKTDKDTRKAKILGEFKNGALTAYTIIYDHESPLV